MIETKTYLPVTITMAELAHYGENHDDAWVREMARHVSEICDAINNTNYLRVSNLSELIDAFNDDIHDFESSIRYAEEELAEEQQRRIEAVDRYEALKFDLDKDEQVAVIRNLKAELMARNETIRKLNQQTVTMQQEINSVYQKLNDTKERLDMWTIMNKV